MELEEGGWMKLWLCYEQELQRHWDAKGCWQEENRAGFEILLPKKLLMEGI